MFGNVTVKLYLTSKVKKTNRFLISPEEGNLCQSDECHIA